MTTKLTLSINKKTVQRAKLISRKRGKSISKMVEEFLDSINEKEEQKESVIEQINKIMSKYEGKIKLQSNVNYKDSGLFLWYLLMENISNCLTGRFF